VTNALWIIGHLIVALLCIPLIITDWRERRLPNPLTLALAVVVVATLVVGAIASGRSDWVVQALLGALAFAGAPLVIHLIRPASMGFGDVKLTAGLGLLIGWYDPIMALGALFWAVIFALPHALWGWIVDRRERARIDTDEPRQPVRVPFGPYLIAGAALIVGLNFALPG